MPLRSSLQKGYINTILQEIPALSSLFSAYASIITTIMLLRTMFDQFLPPQVRRYVIKALKYYWEPKSSDTQTLEFEEKDGRSPNNMFNVAEAYLCTIISLDSKRLRITKKESESHFNIKFAKSQQIVDSFEGISVTWEYLNEKQKKEDNDLTKIRRCLTLKFDQIHRDIVLTRYLPSIIKKVEHLKNQKKAVKIFSLETRGFKAPVNLDHPSTFDTLAMDPNQKKAIIDDLDLFVRRRDFYKKVGKVWKRGYLLYGPPGTGKSSLIAAMANYLKFDVYDLQLMNVRSDSSLKDMMLQTSNRSILVIEDIDCSTNMPNRNGTTPSKSKSPSDSKFSLSGLLNFIDGLWSCCGDERIIIFTTNHLEKLDPALLRPGRMDMHIHMSYLTFNGFKILAANYLNIHNDHWRFREIEELIRCKKVTPAEVAEELLKSDNAEVVLEGLVKFLKGKKNGAGATTTKGDEVLEAKTDNI
ncbi:AAA+ ATPase domain-containing protein [Artemisia annua]|uniref:AAA+ ATPase domain-containing protein n=1 Tax=Artemisia annua TaxID=35608 RepID=A0A2U1NMS3_ARTAN|nr:AAA+ ATPase domain-containing protein [Artemisia annua]